MDEELLDSLAAASIATLRFYRERETEQKHELSQQSPDPVWDWKIEWSEKFIDAIDAELYRRALYGY